MKLNWGTGIAIFYGLFMVVMIAFVVKSKSVDHSLVMDNYYEADIKYQSHMDKVANSKALETDLEINKVAGKGVELQFPALPEAITGEVWFYRPNDSSRDFKMSITPDTQGAFTVNTKDILPGLWRIKVQWESGGDAYYKEKELYL